jgi:hypothetical protein
VLTLWSRGGEGGGGGTREGLTAGSLREGEGQSLRWGRRVAEEREGGRMDDPNNIGH